MLASDRQSLLFGHLPAKLFSARSTVAAQKIVMTFLNPLLLLSLVAAGIPILLHLLNLRKLQTVEFSTLSFLKELQRTRIRRLKIRQILLMILRTLLVVLIVLAFARPTIKGSVLGGVGTQTRTTILLLLDDSFSMTGTDRNGEFLKQARQTAREIVNLMTDGDEMMIIRFSEVGRGEESQHQAIRDPAVAQRIIDDVQSNPVHTKLEDVLRYAAKLIVSSKNYNREIYLISDMQHGLLGESGVGTSAAEALFPPEIRLFVFPLGEGERANVGIESVQLPGSLFEPSKPFALKVALRNASKENLQNQLVSVFLNNTRVAQRAVDLASESSSEIEFSITSPTSGFVEGFVEIEDDLFSFDNKRFFTVHIPDRIRVLIVGRSENLRFLRLAVGTRQSNAGSVFEMSETTPERLGLTQLQGTDVVLLVGPDQLSAPQLVQLGSYVQAGGGIVVFPASSTQLNRYNETVAPTLKTPRVLSLDGAPRGADEETESFVQFEKVELEHPLFRGMFETETTSGSRQRSGAASQPQRTVESPNVSLSVRYAVGPELFPLITLSNGAPFLVEQQAGSGRLLLVAVAPNLAWSDFPVKGLFVPLLHRSISYLVGESSQQREHLAGQIVTVMTRAQTTGSWTLRAPSSTESILLPTRAGSHMRAEVNQTDAVGIYRVVDGSTTVQAFAVNLHPDESKTVPMEREMLLTLLRRLGLTSNAVVFLDRPQEVQERILEARHGVELWKEFLIAALLLAMIELFVARASRNELTTTSA